MATIWLVSDTHFMHKGMAEDFTLRDGSPARGFTSDPRGALRCSSGRSCTHPSPACLPLDYSSWERDS